MATPPELEPRHLLAAYAAGAFPMDRGWDDDGPVTFYESDPRAILPLPVRVPRSVRRELARSPYALRVGTAFHAVVEACSRRDEPEGVWLSARLVEAYLRLHALGFATSLETWAGEQLVGGMYGVRLGGAFFAESMFHVAPGAGSFAIARGMEHLAADGVRLVDIQMPSEHLSRFGAVEVSREEYYRLLDVALEARLSEGDRHLLITRAVGLDRARVGGVIRRCLSPCDNRAVRTASRRRVSSCCAGSSSARAASRATASASAPLAASSGCRACASRASATTGCSAWRSRRGYRKGTGTF